MIKGAIVSQCKKYRYSLWRIWDSSKPSVLFIMLNPSTADGMQDDNTITRCINFSKQWGYGGLFVGNLFAYRSTDPKQLNYTNDPVGPDNNKHLNEMFCKAAITVLAWGKSLPKHKEQPVLSGLDASKFHYLELTKDGTPRHPLYLPKYCLPKKLTINSNL